MTHEDNVHPVRIDRDAHLISSFWRHPGAPIGVHINTMVLTGAEPVLFDTGVRADRDGWLRSVKNVVDPRDVRWIALTHDDHDHVGNLEAALDEFPNATVAANWFITERLTGSIEVDPRRLRWVDDGDTLDIGDRSLVFARPPLFDSPTTRAIFDPSTGLYWGGDLGAAPSPVAAEEADQIPAEALVEMFLVGHRWNSPWYEMLDDARYQRAVTELQRFGIRTWASTHGPVYRGRNAEWALRLLRRVPGAEPVPQPSQSDLDSMIASLQSVPA